MCDDEPKPEPKVGTADMGLGICNDEISEVS